MEGVKTMDNNMLWFWLSRIPGIGPVRVNSLLQYFETAENIFAATEAELKAVSGIGRKTMDSILKSRDLEKIKRSYDKLKERGIYFVAKNEAKYPEKLRHNFDAPLGLYVRGELPREDKKVLAIVGARDCSSYGRELAYLFAKELSKAGIQIISGMARGVDSAGRCISSHCSCILRISCPHRRYW